ncbi:hypothetical protein QHH11_27160 [Aphanizomenon sp. PH219]|uniref:Transposase n=1 Tax=Dolichospermum heterosporum TAC447 TaxID=747523 RepID=A0ABY5LRB8_9CYAN|nr:MULTISPECIES: hypothetical protein [Aphanizomenonaceae]MDK2412657.1 hypothetical protein [Aphanizomenon sp. 202]MDK2462752.1 hypothetical protein [Aphanizomenon sp. PH219]UUO13461.1 hypothetical protein NG743_15335 [Dolichospermum heterosporum TAC447]
MKINYIVLIIIVTRSPLMINIQLNLEVKLAYCLALNLDPIPHPSAIYCK